MSNTPPPPTARPGIAPAADAASLRQVRALFQRKMLERAISLADSRWPGSGDMVRLAAEWADLTPAERRTRLSQIGPEDLSRLRALADLNPDLARVLDDLESRGVLPPTLYSSEAGVATQEALVDAALNLGQEAATTVAARTDDPHAQAAIAAAGTLMRGRLDELQALPQVEMPVLDLGLPSTDEFLLSEAERRAAAADAATSILDRVRQRIDHNAQTLLRSEPQLELPPLPETVSEANIQLAAIDAQLAQVTPTDVQPPPTTALIEQLTTRFETEQVIVIVPEDSGFGTLNVMSLSSELQLPLREFILSAGESRAVFGGLERRGPEVRVVPGPLPIALAGDNLVVIRGKVFPTMLARWRGGLCDIPGTKASTRIAPGCRILVT